MNELGRLFGGGTLRPGAESGQLAMQRQLMNR